MLDIKPSELWGSFQERLLRTFPERQFIHRTGGRVDYFILSTRAQVMITSAAFLVAAWFLFTFINVLWGQSPLGSSSKELMVQKAQYDRYIVDLEAQEQDARSLLETQQTQFELAAKHFEDKHNTIVNMITLGGIAASEDDLNFTQYASSQVLMSPMITDVVERQPRVSFDEIGDLTTGTVLDASLVNLDGEQNMLLKNGENKIQSRIETARAILRSTSIPLEKILANGEGGMGGPLIETGEEVKIKPGGFLSRLDGIKARSAEVAALERALDSIPLAFPIDAENYVTSAYGARKDPFTKRPTKHSGMDIASYKLAPIIATANGKIKFVGRRSGYGRVVEIDHGYGFKTRYAHLEKTYVKRGQKVEKGEKIAGMGSTGRSTSTHLHYEIIFEDRTYNPKLFMKAGQYVQ